MARSRPAVLALLCCASVVFGGIAVADSAYQVSVPESIDTPDRVVTLEGNEYTVSAIGVVSPGDPITAELAAPDGTDYSVYLYDNNRNVVDTKRVIDHQNTETVSFPTDDYDAGSYVLAVYGPDGNFRAVHPVVIRSYGLSVDAPKQAEPGETIEVTVSVENVTGTTEQLNFVQVVLSNGDDRTLRAAKTGDGTYTVETSLSASGEYLVYANARGYDDANEHKELIGADNTNAIEVRDPTPTESETSVATETATDEGQGGPNPSSTDTPTDTATPTETPSPTMSPTDTETETSTATDTPTQTTTSEGVVTPNETGSPTQTTGAIHAAVPLVAIVTFLLWRRS